MTALEVQTPQLTVATWHIVETEAELLSAIPASAIDQARLAQLHNPSRRLEWLAVRAMICQLLDGEPHIAYHPDGCPYLTSHTCSLSISHTKGYAALALSKQGRIGIDIEQIGNRVCRVAARFLRDDEQFHHGDPTTLTILWTAKEALFKLLGGDAANFLLLRVYPFTVAAQGTFQATFQSTDCLLHYRVTDNYVLTIAQEAKRGHDDWPEQH